MLVGVFAEDIDAEFLVHFQQDPNGIKTSDIYVPSTGSRTLDIILSFTLLALGLVIPVGMCCVRRSIDIVLASLAATLECLTDMPVLLIKPLISVIVRVLLMALAAVGMAWVLSIGAVSNYQLTALMPSGLTRKFEYSEGQWWIVLGYFFVAAWVFEFVCALEQFTFIYGVQMWFFTPYTRVMGIRKKNVSQCFMMRGVFLGFTYYFGTLAFGSLMLAVCRLISLVMSILFRQTKSQNDEGSNKVAQVAAGCCMCCLKCWENVIRYLNKLVYTVVLVNSQSFCRSAETLVEVIASEFVALGVLEGATKLFQLGGMVTITAAGGLLTWFTLGTIPMFTDPSSPNFVLQPEYLAIVASLMCAVIAWVFMDVFDTVSDTILLCWALDKKARAAENLPPNPDLPSSLIALLDKASQRNA